MIVKIIVRAANILWTSIKHFLWGKAWNGAHFPGEETDPQSIVITQGYKVTKKLSQVLHYDLTKPVL